MKSLITKNTRQTLAILIVMQMRRWDSRRIAWWSTSWASLEATGCCHRASACIVLPWWLPWLMSLVKSTKQYQTTIFSLSTYGRLKPKAMRISGPEADPLLSSSMQQDSFKCETLRLELKSLATFLLIKRCERTKIEKGSKLSRSLL